MENIAEILEGVKTMGIGGHALVENDCPCSIILIIITHISGQIAVIESQRV